MVARQVGAAGGKLSGSEMRDGPTMAAFPSSFPCAVGRPIPPSPAARCFSSIALPFLESVISGGVVTGTRGAGHPRGRALRADASSVHSLR